jgi:hypothetical protein
MEAGRRAVARVAAGLALLALVAPAAAAAETGAQVRALARAAETSRAALARLRAVTRVDGRPVRLAQALRTSDPAELHARLEALAAGGSAPAPAIDAGRAARAILAERRFRGSSVPRPLHGFLAWLGARFRPVVRLVDRLGRHVPGGSSVVWALLAAIVVSLSAFLAGRAARNRGLAALERHEHARRAGSTDPGELERLADGAEVAGDAAAAVRLRYRAGLLRLGRAHVVPLRESLTSGEARRLLRSADFDALARTHDEVAYGGRAASIDDAVAARVTWPRVLAGRDTGS